MVDAKKIGLVIKTLRRKRRLTQAQLAEELGITDKAVSKWERGIGSPDISVINRLADILNIDSDNLLAGNVAYLEGEWIGELHIDRFETKLSVITEVYGKPVVYIYLCYFALAGIREIYVYCSNEEEKVLASLLERGQPYGLVLHYNELNQASKKMVIEDSVFIYGPNLTKYFQRGMSHVNKQTRLTIPCEASEACYLNDKNQVSDASDLKQGYRILPIVFYNAAKSVEYEPLGKGMIAINLWDREDVLAVSVLLQVLMRYSGSQIYCLEEIAYRRGLISAKQLKEIADGDEYLLHLAKEK